ncbi:sugar ABC transporter substrate-binding protein [Desertihabitans brevis]|uniref:Sugar ABC transporter substrate-binding protein n=1 Tax=Desertihabitans brevis TaxID=2268447 RepID=A0A367YV35_9ACTN|nr:sugar ABC transporter substrate-binding protein [Desertihabitans brevis]RCK68821.1 sugar ABC transporter substrate-binding protein [Desertihabitans brevis]
MKRSTTIGVGLVLGAVLTTSACGGGADSAAGGGDGDWVIPSTDPTATIDVVGIVDPVSEGMDEVVAAFEADHPTIDVNYQYVPFDDLNSVLDSRITSKTGDPDLFWVDQPRVPALAARGYLEDLTAQFSPHTGALQEATVAASTYQDKLWSLPISNSTQLLYYNLDLLEAAGVEPPSTDPAERITWQQLKEDAATVQAEGGAANGLLLGQPNRYYQLEPLPVSAGGGVGATGEDNLTPAVDNEGWVESMTYYGSLFEDGVHPRGIPAEQTNATFLAGDTAYMVEGNWMVGKLADSDLNWGAALNPVWEGGEPATPNGSWSVGINPFSQDKEAAAVFLKWLALDGESGYAEHRPYAELPANLAGLEAYLAGPAFTGSEAGQQAAEVIAHETANTSVPRVSTVGYIEFEEILGRAFSDIANGSDPQGALQGAQQELVNAWQQYQ